MKPVMSYPRKKKECTGGSAQRGRTFGHSCVRRRRKRSQSVPEVAPSVVEPSGTHVRGGSLPMVQLCREVTCHPVKRRLRTMLSRKRAGCERSLSRGERRRIGSVLRRSGFLVGTREALPSSDVYMQRVTDVYIELYKRVRYIRDLEVLLLGKPCYYMKETMVNLSPTSVYMTVCVIIGLRELH